MEALVEKLCNRFNGVTGILHTIVVSLLLFYHEKASFYHASF